MIQVTALVEAGTLAGDLISCKNVIGKIVNEISNVNTIVVSFKDENDVPIENIELIKFNVINAITGEISEHQVTPDGYDSIRFYHFGTSNLQTTFRLTDNKLVAGRAYAPNENVIESVDDIKITSITYNGTTATRVNPVIE